MRDKSQGERSKVAKCVHNRRYSLCFANYEKINDIGTILENVSFYAHEFDVLDPAKQKSLKKQNDQSFIPQLPAPDWVKVGKIQKLYAYPLISGNEYNVDECEIKMDGIHMIENGIKMKWDRLVRNSDIYFLNNLCLRHHRIRVLYLQQ